MTPRSLHATIAAACLAATVASPALLVAQSPVGAATPVARPTLRAHSATRVVRLDGRLDDAEWGTADSIADLVQIEPKEGAAPTGRTVVRVLVEGDALVFGIRADDPEPSRIVSFARQRDADLDNEDHVKIVLDTYRDGRSGYVFAVNPAGARYDALVSDQGEGENSNWDAVWEAATVRTPTGWSAEVRVPVRSLLFRKGLTTWGFNVQRRMQRLIETDRWASPERDYAITQTFRAGDLTELPDFDLGLGLSVRPALTAGAGVPAARAQLREDHDASLDATQRLGANTLASLTVNTDFAETEVDTRRTNLTRFPLVFPEKRTFFLEGADIFDFGLGLRDDVRPFFSRRIGLLEGREVPIRVGGKVNGRQRGTSYGALVVRTGRGDDAFLDTMATANTMGVVRVKQNVLRESSVGMIGTFGDPTGARGSWLAGPDLTYQTSRFRGDQNFLVGAWALGTDREGLAGRRHAIGGKIDYPNDLLDMAATYKWLGESFLPSLGFVPRPAVQVATLGVDYSPRPRRPIGPLHVRQMFFELQNTLVADLANRWESYRVFTAPVNWRLESGDRFELNVVPTGERLTEPFEIADGVVIPPGSYHWNRYRVEGGLATKRRFAGQGTWWFGDFYSGRLHEIELDAVWRASSLLILELVGVRNVGRLPEGDFTQDLVGTRLRVNVSPDLQVNSYVQFDNESESVGSNTRLRWTFSPLGDLFVVYNHNLRHALTDPDTGLPLPGGIPTDPTRRYDRRWGFASNQLLVKLQYAFRY